MTLVKNIAHALACNEDFKTQTYLYAYESLNIFAGKVNLRSYLLVLLSERELFYKIRRRRRHLKIKLHQGRAKPNFWTRNRNQWVLKGNFRTTKSKPICMNGIIQNQNRNQFLIYKKFEIKIKTEMQKAVLFKTETETNIRSYLVTMTS